MNKKRYLSIAYVICLVMLFSNIPYALFIKNEIILFIVNMLSEFIALIIFFYMIKNENIKHKFTSAFTKNSILYIPFLLICFSNFFVVFYQSAEIKNSIDYSNLIFNIILCIPNVIIEELLFRYLVCYEFDMHVSKFKTILYSSLIFGSIHLLNISSIGSIPTVLVQVLYTFGIGLILGLIYLKSNYNIIYPTIIHLLFNVFNDIIVVNMFDFKWDASFFVINSIIAIFTCLYAFFIFKVGDKDVS